MNLLNKKDILFERDENGEVIPVEKKIKVKKLGEDFTIKVLPIPRGKWLRMLKMPEEEQDKIMVTEHVADPKFSAEEYEDMGTVAATAITTAIISVTLDIDADDASEVSKEELTEVEEAVLKKKSRPTSKE